MTDLSLTFDGAAITTAARDTRLIRGTVLPYGVPGFTSAGKVRVQAGALQLPGDSRHVVLRDLHGGQAVGVASELNDSATALTAAFRVAKIPAGDALLIAADPECPIKGGLSVELADVAFSADEPDLVVHARLTAVAAVEVPAFTTARTTSVAAAHTPQEGTAPVTMPTPAPAAPIPAPVPAAPIPAPAPVPQPTAPAAPEGTLQAAMVVPGTPGVPVAPVVPVGTPAAPAGLHLDRVTELLAAYGGGMGQALTPELTAALSDITYSGQTATRQAEWLGELWSGPGYTRRFVPLFTKGPKLTAMRGVGWRWVQKPEVDDYAGNKAAVPSNEVTTAPADWTAQRVAGAWDVDRAYVDFGDTGFYRSFLSATTDSYRQKTDRKALAFLIANAVSAPTLADTYDYVPDVAPDVLTGVAILSGLLGDIPTVESSADYVLMNTGTLLRLAGVTGLDVPAFLALLGIDTTKFRHSNLVPVNTLIMGTTSALEYRELGDTPIRVDALDIARGGVDTGVFGYLSLFLQRENGVLSLPVAPVAGV